MTPAPERLRLRTTRRSRHRPGAMMLRDPLRWTASSWDTTRRSSPHAVGAGDGVRRAAPGGGAQSRARHRACPDPYVERLLEGVAFLAARTRLKLDGEESRFAAPCSTRSTPICGADAGHRHGGAEARPAGADHARRPRGGARHPARRRAAPRAATRATFTTAQDVTLWPVEIAAVAHFQDRSALAAAGIGRPPARAGEAALRVTLREARRRRLGSSRSTAGPPLPQPRQGAGALRRALRCLASRVGAAPPRPASRWRRSGARGSSASPTTRR